MARTLLHRICTTRDEQEGGGFESYEIFWDDVERTTVHQDANVLSCEPFRLTEGTLLDAWCEGTTKVEILYAYTSTHVRRQETPNSDSCTVPPCGLKIDAVEVTFAPGEGNTGIATIHTSGYTGPLEYSLNGFVDVQSSNVFTGLYIGDYIAYVRAPGVFACTATFPFSIEPPRGPRFRMEFTDAANDAWRIDWMQRGYEGLIEGLTGAGTPAVFDWQAAGNKLARVKGSGASFNILVDRPDLLRDFYTADERKFRIDAYRNDILYWQGYHLPDLYLEPWLAHETHPQATLQAADGLGALKDTPYLTDTGNRYFGRTLTIEVLFKILRKLDLTLPVYLGVNLFEDRMDKEHEPLMQSQVDETSYHDKEKGAVSCYEVLEKLLQPYGAYVRQSEGALHVLRFHEQKGAYNRRLAELGTSEISAVYDGAPELFEELHTISRNGVISYREGSQSMSAKPAVKRGVVTVEYGEMESFLRNADFQEWGNGTPLSWTGTAPVEKRLNEKGDGFVLGFTEPQSGPTPNRYIESDPYIVKGLSGKMIAFSFEISGELTASYEMPLLYMEVRVGNYWLKEKAEWNPNDPDKNATNWQWVTTQNAFYVRLEQVNGTGRVGFDGTYSVSSLPLPSITGEITAQVRFYEPSCEPDQSVDLLFNIDNVRLTEYLATDVEKMIIKGENPGYITGPPVDVTLYHGSNLTRSQALITLADGEPTQYWEDGKLLQEIWLREVLFQHERPTFVLSGTVTGPCSPIAVMQDIDFGQARFVVDGFSLDARTGLATISALQVFGGIEEDVIRILEDGTPRYLEDNTYRLIE